MGWVGGVRAESPAAELPVAVRDVDADDLAFALTALALGVITAIETGVGFDPVRVRGVVQRLLRDS